MDRLGASRLLFRWQHKKYDKIYCGNKLGSSATLYVTYTPGNPKIALSTEQTVKSIQISSYPNPFNPITTIQFSLPERSHVSLDVYSINGQLVESLVEDILHNGVHEVRFDGSSLSSGTYFYKLTSDNMVKTGKMQLVK